MQWASGWLKSQSDHGERISLVHGWTLGMDHSSGSTPKSRAARAEPLGVPLQASPIYGLGRDSLVAGDVDSLVQEQNRAVVTHAAGDDEQMPNPMAPGVPVVEYEKDDARGVEDAARQ